MKAFVDQETCISCGICTDICPEVFSLNDDGLAEASTDEIDESVLEKAKEAQSECPVDAITLE